MNKTKKILSLSGIVLILVIIVAYLIFSGRSVCNALEIEIVDQEKELIIDKEDINKIIFTKYKDLIGSSFKSIDLAQLEQIIESHPSVKNAEVYKKVNGLLMVTLEQKIPIVRIMPISGNNFYIDKDGNLFPVSKVGSARVLVASGNIKFKYDNTLKTIGVDSTLTENLKDIYLIAGKINSDAFLKAQIEQIYVTKKNEYELIPKVGNHIVLIGDIFNYEKKLKYLKHFYHNVMNKAGWRSYNYINLKYKDQIVCTKNES